MAEKTNRNKYVTVRLWKYLYAHKGFLFLSIFLAFGNNALSLLGPYLSGFAIDAIELGTGKVDFQTVLFYATLMLIFYAVSSLFSYFLSRSMIALSQKITYQMRKDLFNKLMDLPVNYFDKTQTGDIISRISYDIDTVNTSLSHDIVQILTSIITIFGSIFMMLTISPPLVLVFAVTVPISILWTKHRSGKVRPLFRTRTQKLGEMNGFIEEIITGQKTTKAYHQEKIMIERFDEKNEEAVQAYYKADYYGGTTGPSVNFINNLSLSLISVFGAILFLLKSITLGNLSSFILYSRKFSGPINEISNLFNELQSAYSAAERIFRLIDEDPEPKDDTDALEITNVKGDIRFENVSFGYLPGQTIIKNLNLEAAQGDLIAIVGPTGAGKTTIINLLMRFYDIDSGNIYLDGHDIRTLTRKSLRLSYAMVLQDTWLFSGTVFENIAYGKKDATMEDVVAAAKAANIHSYIEALPKGYDTILSENGSNISKGQKQMLTIARAMLLEASILILDEATSNVDTSTEQKIQAAMRNLMKEKTCFVIAHRLSTIKNADQILVVRDGNIVEKGVHRELLEKDGYYAELYNAQFL